MGAVIHPDLAPRKYVRLVTGREYDPAWHSLWQNLKAPALTPALAPAPGRGPVALKPPKPGKALAPTRIGPLPVSVAIPTPPQKARARIKPEVTAVKVASLIKEVRKALNKLAPLVEGLPGTFTTLETEANDIAAAAARILKAFPASTEAQTLADETSGLVADLDENKALLGRVPSAEEEAAFASAQAELQDYLETE